VEDERAQGSTGLLPPGLKLPQRHEGAKFFYLGTGGEMAIVW